MDITTLDIAIITLLVIVSGVGITTRWLQMPYPIALVLTGVALGALVHNLPLIRGLPIEHIPFTPHLILVVFLPALLFESTLHIEAATLSKALLPIALLAIPGVLLTAGIVGALVHWGIGLDWLTALLFGSIVAATDPIAVLAIFKRTGAPHALAVLIEGESLFNDGTAVVLSRIILGVLLAGTFDIFTGVLDFILVVGGGLVVGLVTGSLVSRLTARIDDHLIEITLTTILAYGTYVLAEALHVSGVIGVVAAGLVLGNVGARHSMSPTTRLALLTFWEYVAFLLNSAIFLLIGVQVDLGSLVGSALPVTIAIGAVILARLVVVYGLGVLFVPFPPALPRGWLHVMFWAGLRGALSLAVVLSLPLDLPARSLLLTLSFGVVLFTLVVPGLTMEPLLHWLRISERDPRRRVYLARRAELLMLQAARRELQRLQGDAVLSTRVYTQLDATYRVAGQQLQEALEALYQTHADLELEELRATHAQLLQIERVTLTELQRRGQVDSDIAGQLAAAVDARAAALETTNRSIRAADTAAPTSGDRAAPTPTESRAEEAS